MTNEELIQLYSKLRMGRAAMQYIKKTTKFYQRSAYLAAGASLDSAIVNIHRVALKPSYEPQGWSGKN